MVFILGAAKHSLNLLIIHTIDHSLLVPMDDVSIGTNSLHALM